MNASWIVVPDGLAADPQGRALPEPSFVYRAVLDWIGSHAGPGDTIYLAPANYFGGDVPEQEAGRRYLQAVAGAVTVTPASPLGAYIDTRGNARLLRAELEATGRWPLPAAHLVAYALHLPRAIETFEQEGFTIAQAHSVPFDARAAAGRIVRRLWYYRYPFVHRAYEFAALAMTRMKFI